MGKNIGHCEFRPCEVQQGGDGNIQTVCIIRYDVGSNTNVCCSDPIFGSKPIHDFKTAFIAIKNFRPMLVRVPLGPGAQDMSTKEHIVLDVDTFDVKASFGADTWGKPRDVELHEDVKLWAEGLRQGGGAGYDSLSVVMYLRSYS